MECMKILVDGQLVEYKDNGKGKVIFLLHGWGMSKATFDELATHLTGFFRVINIDFPGFGASPKPSDDWHAGDYAKLLHNMIVKMNIPDVFAFIGHSFGGRIIIKGISEGLLKCDRVVLIGSAGVKPSRGVKSILLNALAKTGRVITALPGLQKLQPGLRKKLYRTAGSTDYLESGDMQQIFMNIINEDLLPLVRDIKQPTLLLWGENDAETPLDHANKMMNLMSRASLKVIPNAGHFVYLDDPESVKDELNKFLI